MIRLGNTRTAKGRTASGRQRGRQQQVSSKPNLNLIFFCGPVPFSSPGGAAPHRGMTTQPITTPSVQMRTAFHSTETTLSPTSKLRVPERQLTCSLDAAEPETVYPLPCPFHVCMEGGVLGLHNSSADSQARRQDGSTGLCPRSSGAANVTRGYKRIVLRRDRRSGIKGKTADITEA